MHRFLLHNDDVHDTHVRDASPGQTGLLNGWGVFSTIRVADGVMFAFERHWARMKRDAERMHVPFPSERDELEGRLQQLIQSNKALNATLRVVVVRNHGGPFEGPGIERDYDIVAFTTNLADWGDSVRLGIKPFARYAQNEFAGAKILSWAHNLTWYEEAHQRGFDEYLLLNERGEVCECTSANIFAIEGSQVTTPPLSSGCLPGVTRELLLESISIPGVSITERTIMPADLEQADSVVITSTTRDLLPVSFIEGLRIRHESKLLEPLEKALRHYRDEYVRNHSSEPVSTGLPTA
ncbi:MAG TPA: aminotransferase class IV [Bryobacteraceae bacterium]|nr:aminotransferase class IV [Bryobacteraceae bacterium]